MVYHVAMITLQREQEDKRGALDCESQGEEEGRLQPEPRARLCRCDEHVPSFARGRPGGCIEQVRAFGSAEWTECMT